MFKDITLEMSLKPFLKTDDEYIKKVVLNVFRQWNPLLKDRKSISIMLWTAEGSEILDYSGNIDAEFEWARYMGRASNPFARPDDPLETSLHKKKRLYVDNPPVMTYRILQSIVRIIKEEGKRLFPNSQIRVGETFDVGPEFAVSEFKYKRHPEICSGFSMGFRSLLNSYGVLNGDDYSYAGFPNGIPDKTPFGTFFGRQVNIFLKDMGFDFLWLSNGVGFSANPWNANGVIFDGCEFHVEKLEETKKKLFNFWKLFREECPDYFIETRGTNNSVGIDYATDAVCLYDIYNSNFNLLPPPNSPWAAMDGNFGLELMGHMSRICELPGEDFLFRYYIHDPWWVNSPWYDRYDGRPHDIYMPMAVSRIDENGKTQTASYFNILSIDNTFGNMPDSCVNEPLPHILNAEKEAADEPAIFTWVYPMQEFTTTNDEKMLRKMMSGDWFICQAINNGFPLNSVVSCDNFIKTNKELYKKTILITPVPSKGSKFEKEIFNYIENNGKVLFYGSLDNASELFLSKFRINIAQGISNEAEIVGKYYPDIHDDGVYANKVIINEFMSDGIVNTLTDSENDIKLSGYSLTAEYKNALWYRALLGAKQHREGGHPIPDSAKESVKGEILLRKVIEKFGYKIYYKKYNADVRTPAFTVHRCKNAQIFSVYSPNTTVEMNLHFPLGAPILYNFETEISNSVSKYRFARSENAECRVFVEQESGKVSVRKIDENLTEISGLENSLIRYFPKNKINAYYNNEEVSAQEINSSDFGRYFEFENITGKLLICEK